MKLVFNKHLKQTTSLFDFLQNTKELPILSGASREAKKNGYYAKNVLCREPDTLRVVLLGHLQCVEVARRRGWEQCRASYSRSKLYLTQW